MVCSDGGGLPLNGGIAKKKQYYAVSMQTENHFYVKGSEWKIKQKNSGHTF